jgi:ABC-2 type transport system ATP-binding protein
LKIAAGSVVPDDGEVDVAAASVGFVAGGERSFYWRLSGTENLRFFAVLFGLPARDVGPRVAGALERVGLTERAGEPVRNYSAGMRQRLAFARALLNEPDLLLVDELAGELDYPGTLALGRFVRDELVGAEGRGALVATHQLWLARALADRVVVLVRGKVVAAGPPREILGAPAARYGARLAGEAEGVARALREYAANVEITAGPAGKALVQFDEPADAEALAAAFRVLEEAGAEPAIRVAEVAERAYLTLVGADPDA